MVRTTADSAAISRRLVLPCCMRGRISRGVARAQGAQRGCDLVRPAFHLRPDCRPCGLGGRTGFQERSSKFVLVGTPLPRRGAPGQASVVCRLLRGDASNRLVSGWIVNAAKSVTCMWPVAWAPRASFSTTGGLSVATSQPVPQRALDEPARCMRMQVTKPSTTTPAKRNTRVAPIHRLSVSGALRRLRAPESDSLWGRKDVTYENHSPGAHDS
jgi:hypothetical protein